MKTVMVRYKVKADRSEENERYISKVFEELSLEQPAGFRYAALKLEDGVSFVHLVFAEPSESPVSLADMPAFKAFVADISDRCDEPPVASGVTYVGSYGFLE
jgi:hypothetical protein